MARKPSQPSTSAPMSAAGAGPPASTSSSSSTTTTSAAPLARIHPSYQHQHPYALPPPSEYHHNASATSSPSSSSASWQPTFPPRSSATMMRPAQGPSIFDYAAATSSTSPASTSYQQPHSKAHSSPSQASGGAAGTEEPEEYGDHDNGDHHDDMGPAKGKGSKRGAGGGGSAAASRASPSGSASKGSPKASKRQRVHFSCTECHRRKQKCNRETPCNHCIARKVPERCKTFRPGNEEGMDLTARVAKLERSVEEGFDRLASMMAEQAAAAAAATNRRASIAPPPPPVASHPAAAQSQQPLPSTALPPPQSLAQNPSQFANSRRVSFAPPVLQDGSETGDEPNEGAGLNDAGNFHGSGATISMRIDSLLSDVGGSEQSSGGESSQQAAGKAPTKGILSIPTRSEASSRDDDLDSRMAEYGAADKISAAFVSTVPSREVCRQLTDHYFEDVNWLRHPLPEKLLRPQINAYIDAPGQFPAPLTTANVNIFACMMLLMSIAALSVESDSFPKDGRARRMAARRFEWTGRRTLLLSQVLGKDDLLQVMGFNLAWRFLMLDRRMSEGWRCVSNSITAGYSIGLHRDGSKLGLPSLETDLRRGVWQTITFADVSLSMTFGRPPISDLDRSYSDTALPTFEGFKHWWPNEEPSSHSRAKPGKPLPTIYQHTLNRSKIMRVCSRIVECYQKLEPHHYSDILAIDAELLKVREELPYYYQASVKREDSSVECDRSLDDDFPFLLIHRFLVHTEIFFCRISLHRSYLLRSGAKGSSGHRFAPSRRACIESAMEDLAMRTDFVERLIERYGGLGKIPLWLYIHVGTYSWFNSLLVASIAALLDPSDMPELPMLKEQLDRFLRAWDRKKQGLPPEGANSGSRAYVEIKDEMRDKEATILAMFRQAIDRAQATLAANKGVGAGVANASGAGKRSRDQQQQSPANRSSKASKVSNAASREEATADVLLDLGKTSDSTAKTAEGNSSRAPSPQQSASHAARTNRATPTSATSTPVTASAQLQHQHPPHHLRNESNAAMDAQTPSAASTGSVSTPFASYGMMGGGAGSTAAFGSSLESPTGTGMTGRSGQPQQQQQQQRSVDSAQADFNAWFANEFSMGSSMAMNLGGGGADALVSPAEVGGALAGGGLDASQMGGIGGFAGGNETSPADWSANAAQSSVPAVQWSTLPRPTWDSMPSNSGTAPGMGPPTSSSSTAQQPTTAAAFDAQNFFLNNVHPTNAAAAAASHHFAGPRASDPYAAAAAAAVAAERARGGGGGRYPPHLQQQLDQQRRASHAGFLDPQTQLQGMAPPPQGEGWASFGGGQQQQQQQQGMGQQQQQQGAGVDGAGAAGGNSNSVQFWADLISKISTS